PGESYPYDLVESSDRTESVVGEELTVRLPGEGWLYLGESEHSDEVRFLSQREREGETVFRFRISRSGEYELQFQRQELLSGRVSEHTLEVAALSSGSDGSRGVAAEGGEGLSGGEESAQELPEVGEEEPVAGSDPGAESLRWPEEFTNDALLQDPAETLRRAGESDRYDAVALAELVAGRGDPQGAISLLEAYQGIEERELELDELWFRMARLLEREEEARDLRRAVELYERIVDEYPLSDYYGASRQRVEYLKRHFFLVR
ncbi:MAG: hypothetical protein ACOC25_09115, partial [Alkalispirochaetaceae bacterium]